MLTFNRQALADDGREFVSPPAVVVERDKTERDEQEEQNAAYAARMQIEQSRIHDPVLSQVINE
ncbi:hypothetical protein [Nostoc sp. FACHB-145]|uniref:hypothetical protein n=1 Tax=Nostoc sp. FACHB-145 TaxID=2692836 RepID=UPI0018EF779B|nr:hypothetical protein [Nostoc sp. FACHB-145]